MVARVCDSVICVGHVGIFRACDIVKKLRRDKK